MEKNIKKRVCRALLALVAVLAIVFGYWFFYSHGGYCQKKKNKRWMSFCL